MKHFYWWLLMIVLGSAGLIVIVMFESITLNNETEYYVLKEAMEAAMLESIDIACYNISSSAVATGCDGQLKISEQKFVENFTRRFASVITGDVDDYEILFYDIVESPPKVSVVINSSNGNFKLISDSIDIENGLSGILEAKETKKSIGSKDEIKLVPDVSVEGDITINDSGGYVDKGDNNSDLVKNPDEEECPKDANGVEEEWCADPDDAPEGEGGSDCKNGEECDE